MPERFEAMQSADGLPRQPLHQRALGPLTRNRRRRLGLGAAAPGGESLHNLSGEQPC